MALKHESLKKVLYEVSEYLRGKYLEKSPIGGCFVHQMATYRCDDTRGCVMQF